MKFNQKQLAEIYDILVTLGGASPVDKEDFIQSHLDSTPCRRK